MPIRMLRDWTDSDKMNSLSVHAERFFTRLIMKADDFGGFYGDPRLIKANLFPLQLDTIREADITRWMAECQKAGLIVLYEVDKKRYIRIEGFNQRMRIKKAKYPCPTDDRHVSVMCPPEDEKEIEKEVEGPTTDPRYEKIYSMFRRITTWKAEQITTETGKFLNKYPLVPITESGPLVNAWAANYRDPGKKSLNSFV